MSVLLAAAQRAYDEVEIYKLLYDKRPYKEEEIPFISHVDYHKAINLLGCITEQKRILGAVPAYHRRFRRIPLTPLESTSEWSARLERLTEGLRHLGVPVDQSPRFLLLADDSTGPFACDLSTCLGWMRSQASIAYPKSTAEHLQYILHAHRPDYVLIVSPAVRCELLEFPRSRIITIRHVDDSNDEAPYDRLLVCDEIQVIGSSRARDTVYHYHSANLLVEEEPSRGFPAITTTTFACFPLVRYSLGRKFRLVNASVVRHELGSF